MPTTDRLNLPTVGDPEVVTPDVLRETHDPAMDILQGAVLYDEGPIAGRPPSTMAVPGVAGRLYRSTDESPSRLYYDTGTAWVAIVSEGDARLTNARTPTAHAASHAGGSDRLYTAGSGFHNGVGAEARAHGLGVTPSAVLVVPTVNWTRFSVRDVNSSTFLPDFETATNFYWVAFR